MISRVKLLVRETMEELSIDPSELRTGSHKKVVIQCTNCNKIMTREYKRVHLHHVCPTRIVKNGAEYKWCNNHKQYLPIDKFSMCVSKPGKLTAFCSDCRGEKHAMTQTILNKWMTSRCTGKRNDCKRRKIPYDIDVEYMMDIWAQQNGKCYYSHVQLTYNDYSLTSAQIERIVPALGYTRGNVAWASKALNLMKSDHTYKEWLDFIRLTKFNDHFKLNFSVDPGCPIDVPIKPPVYPDDVGYDLGTAIDTDSIDIPANGFSNLQTYVRLELPPGVWGDIRPRSSTFVRRKLIVMGGTIDGGYRGLLSVFVYNPNPHTVTIYKGDYLAQLVLHPILVGDLTKVNSISPSVRGEKGFGSSHGFSEPLNTKLSQNKP
jgi:dUTP pyrophosphatase